MGWDISVPLGSRSYRVVIAGMSAWPALPLPELRWRRGAVVTDDRVGPLWSRPVLRWLHEKGIEVAEVRVPAGEGSKDLQQAAVLYRSFVGAGLHRGDCVIALGGGVVGDLAGFAAATFLRGIDLVQIPTSLLAMVDSSVGGKVGVDFDGVKNLIGSFHQPRVVLTSPEFLRTLEERHLANGLAEAIKAALIGDPDLFALLEKDASSIWQRDEACLGEIIARSVSVKAKIVAEDEREEGRRMALNLGHTLGHAIESVTGYALLHGEAVAIGMVAACHLSYLLGIAPVEHRRRVEAMLREHRLPTSAEGLSWDALLPFLKKDKKLRGDGWTFVLTGGVGDVRVLQRVPEAPFREAVAYVME